MIERFRAKALILGYAFSLVTLASGCMDDPSSVGLKLVPSGDLLQIDTLIANASSSYSQKAAPLSFAGFPTTFAVGRSENFESWGLLSLTSLSDTLSKLVIQGADLHLRAAYHLGDSLASFSVNIHKALVSWNRASFVYDSLMAPGVFELSSTAVPPSTFGDTDEVVLPLDTALVRGWFRAVTDTTLHNYGIVLEPTNSMVIKGFVSNVAGNDAAHLPFVSVRYTDSVTGLTDTLILNGVVDKFVAGMADTTALKDSSLLVVRGGSAYRGVVGFDVSSIPPHALIHRALFEIYADAATSRFASNHHDSLYALFPFTLNPVQISERIADSGQTYFRFNVTEFVQSMARGSGVPQISVAAYEEENGVDLFRIFGSAAANTSKRPHLTILYSRTR